MKIKRIRLQDLVPVIAFLVIFAFFTIASYNPKNGTFRMLTLFNISVVLEQTMQTIIVACGAMFVVSQGSTDLSVGVNLALAGVVGTWAAHVTCIDFLLIPVALVIGLALGIFNGIVLSKFKVPSFMLTLAMLIGIRGLVNYIQIFLHTQVIPEGLTFLRTTASKTTIFFIVVIIMAYVFEYTNLGRYSRAIGDNETTAKFVGIPVDKMKIAAFALSGLMSGIGAIMNIATIGSTSQTMGVFLEIRVIMAVFLGGVLVTGGSSARFYKILLGSFAIQIIINGLAIMGMAQSHFSQTVQGVLLLAMLLVSQLAIRRSNRVRELPDEPPSES